MLFNIPQFIDTEDKIVGPFTAKQLGYLAAAGVIFFVLWTILDFGAFILAAIPVALLFGALAFYRPNGQTFAAFLLSAVSFSLHPKVYVWKRLPQKKALPKKVSSKKDKAKIREKQIITEEKIRNISDLLNKGN